MKEWWEHDYDDWCDGLSSDTVNFTSSCSTNAHSFSYELDVPEEYFARNFSDQEKAMLQPIAETLAMFDGNASFAWRIGASDKEIWEMYLPHAYSLFVSNGGLEGWAGQASWISGIHHPNASVREAYETYLTLKNLVPRE